MIIPVSDLHDPRLADFVGLRDAHLRRADAGRFIAEGLKIIERAFAAGCRPRGFLVRERWLRDLEGALEAWPEVPVYLADSVFIERVSGFHVHRGALASFERPEEAAWERIASASRVIACEEIVDHANLGAIIRVAAGLGWDAVLVSAGSADPLYRRAIKASMGASLCLPWRRMASSDELARLKQAGFTLVASSLSPTAVDLASYAMPERVALLMGTEGSGLSQRWLELADAEVTIPMAQGIDSLNVAAAAAVLAYALRPGRPAGVLPSPSE